MSKWKDLLKTVAPSLATAVGSPAAGLAVRAITGAILGEESDDESVAERAILGASHEQLAALKKADQDFKIAMKKLDVDLEKIDSEDRASARKLAIDKGIMPQVVLSVVVLVGYFTIIYVDATNSEIQIDDFLLGVLTVAVPQVLGFWFGSSSGSKEKTEKLK